MDLLKELTERNADPRVLEFVRSIGYLIKEPNAIDDLMLASDLISDVDVENPDFDIIAKLNRDSEGYYGAFMHYCSIARNYHIGQLILHDKLSDDWPVFEGTPGYEVTTATCYELRDSAKEDLPAIFEAKTNNFIKAITYRFQPELAVMALRTAVSLFRVPINPDKCPAWDAYAAKYQNLIMGR